VDPALADVDRLSGVEDERRLAPFFPTRCDPGASDEIARERLADHLRADRIGTLFRQAAEACGREDAEDARRPLRALARPFLERAATEAEQELERMRAEHEPGSASCETDSILAPDADTRAASFARWCANEDRERELLAARVEMRGDAAARSGARSTTTLLGACHPRAPEEVEREFRRGAIEPLDETIERAAWSRWLRLGWDPQSPPPHEAPRFRALGEKAGRLPTTRVVAIVRRLAAEFGEDPDARGPALAVRPTDGAWTTWGLTRDGTACVVPGQVSGPAGLWDLLGRYGQAARAGRLARMRGTAAVRFCDAAFAVASRTLWRRIAFCPLFRQANDLPGGEEAVRELALVEAVATRVAWSYLELVTTGADDDDGELDRTVRRAGGFPATPADRDAVRDGDPDGASELRGTVLGLLLEERLRLRFGRNWYARPEARRWLIEMWEAEPEMTAEEMARSLDLGTIEPTPMIDGNRGVDAV
jgi:hypothetical protein